MIDTLSERSLKHIWYPCSQMKDYEHFKPLPIRGAQGVYLELTDGQRILDAISSWWCKSLGHGHPRIKAALMRQIDAFEHVIMPNTTHEVLAQLSERLCAMAPHLNKVYYAGDGSSALEIALKMAVHAQQLQGRVERTRFLSLENSYHGETALTLSVSDLGLYRKPYEPLLNQYTFIRDIPYVHSIEDPLWNDCSHLWPAIEAQLEQAEDSLAAIVVEPIVQAAGGMRIYSQDFLRRLAAWCQARDIYLIADEIMTGFGRTGKPLAYQYADIQPDMVCLGKGLTAGWLPMSAVLVRDDIYDLFYDDYESGKAFLHSHTHSGNALCASVALEVTYIMEEEGIYQRLSRLNQQLSQAMREVIETTGCLNNLRHIGAVIASDLVLPQTEQKARIGYQVFKKAVQLGAFLRPLGNTLYWTPPLTILPDEIEKLRDITIKAIKSVL